MTTRLTMTLKTLKQTAVAVGLTSTLWGALAVPASADTQYITALFKPNPANPMQNKFDNTTAQSSICLAHIPAQCKALGIFSLRFDSFKASSHVPIVANHSDPRAGAYFKVPSSFRNVDVRHTKTGELETVQVRIAGVGSLWTMPRPPGVSAWAQPGASWGSQWSTAPTPCLSTRHLAASASYASFFWVVPRDAGACSRVPSVDIAWFNYFSMEYAYELITPNPLGMASGQYVGSITYSVGGAGADFDFGDNMTPSSDGQITLDFTLDVQHELKVDIPPGGTNIELVPQGGWQAWLNQGRKPTRLFRDQTVNLYASSRFKMGLDCQYAEADNDCRVRDSVSGETVPVNVSVTLPFGLTDPVGRPVSRQPLRRDGVGTELFQPTQYVERKPSTLHFEIGRDEVEKMLKVGESRTYSGNITVIWDSEV
ncbi:hypothetical protein PspCFBP13528_05500 [Pseudomonas sp. CFBP13528]|uniref:hypothetical protein n=1 Tax=Pseudomonas sp. CFBP13528 TaxID=2184006 RepID=UPI0010C108D6|nr:hypothetical protein [Pseudomonas sp. CFBP13528]TKK35066.1 hypothetical protein PspCFBP13528_05500 [Pseudomonas sp. CFBP13528]